jgi:hypothetical protein
MIKTTLQSLLLAFVLGAILFYLKYDVVKTQKEMDGLNQEVFSLQESLHIMEAEWNYLSQPRFITFYAAIYLGLIPIKAEQLYTLKEL